MRKAWDELVCPPPSAVPRTPHQSGHLGYIQGRVVSWGQCYPPHSSVLASQTDREFVCVAQGLFLEGSMLAYDPTSNEAEWIPVWGMASDLSQAEEASARELSNMVLHEITEGAQRLDRFREQRSSGEECAEESDTEESATEAPHDEPGDERMDQDDEGGFDGDEESDGTEATLKGSCYPASSQESACSSHQYFSGHHIGGISWADQCLSELEGDPVSGNEEDTSHVMTENDGENPPTPLAFP